MYFTSTSQLEGCFLRVVDYKIIGLSKRSVNVMYSISEFRRYVTLLSALVLSLYSNK